jgi:alpha-1,3-glucosyltransferase
MPQLITRLFPFNRGLNHAYWAPNAWAMVTAIDRALIFGTKRIGLPLTVKATSMSSASRGLVGDTVFGVLPEIKPLHTFVATILFQALSIHNPFESQFPMFTFETGCSS